MTLTAAGSLTDRVDGLDMGADDYLAKPFDSPETDRAGPRPRPPRCHAGAPGYSPTAIPGSTTASLPR